MSDSEFAVKLRIAAHIDEIAEVSKATKNNKMTSDGKNHSFAKDGFTYRRAYFDDFNGQYYEITISVGHNGTIATVYNVGKVNKSVLPSAKKIAVVGSKPLGKTLSKDSIRNPHEIVKGNDFAKSDKVKMSARKGDKPDNRMTEADIKAVQSIGRKSVNAFSSADIKATERFAKQYWKEMGVKSPFFRAWFGDWRANDQTLVQVATKQGDTRGVQKNTGYSGVRASV